MRFIYVFLVLIICSSTAQARQADSVVACASKRYSVPSVTQKVFIGSNYRALWALPVKMKVFHMKEEKGGFTIAELGGGMQTKNLHLKDKNGKEWALRSVDKTVDKAMQAEGIKIGIVKNVAQDMISAANPYGALTVPPMAQALGVVTPSPELFFVPDDPAFGKYRSMFANTVCLLEERKPVVRSSDKVLSTEDLRKQMKKHPGDVMIDEKALLQARLLDMLIGDWDRHDSQWLWAYPKGDKKHIYPIPHDHDQAFFNSDGMLVKMVTPFTMKHIVGYGMDSKRIKKLNRKEWKFDRLFLKDLTEEDWRSGIQTFQSRLTDGVLYEAVHRLPPEVYHRYGDDLLERLKNRRNTMSEYAMDYYHFLIKEIPIPPIDESTDNKKTSAKEKK